MALTIVNGGFDINSWIFEPTKSTAKIKKTTASKAIIHQIFADCALICSDPYWVIKLNRAASDQFPANFSYQQGMLNYRKNGKFASQNISANCYEAVDSIVNFFRRYGKLFSQMDNAKSAERAPTTERIQFAWNVINRSTRDCMISRFIQYTKEVMNLNFAETISLRRAVDNGITSGVFNKETIVIVDNYISAFHGLLWDSQSRTFSVAETGRARVSKPTRTEASADEARTSDISAQWRKCLKQLDSQYAKYSHLPGVAGAPARRVHDENTSPDGTTGLMSSPLSSPLVSPRGMAPPLPALPSSLPALPNAIPRLPHDGTVELELL